LATGDLFFNPGINHQSVGFGKLLDFKMLMLKCLLIRTNPNITENSHNIFSSKIIKKQSGRFNRTIVTTSQNVIQKMKKIIPILLRLSFCLFLFFNISNVKLQKQVDFIVRFCILLM
jgi:hypothetical protein